MLNFCKGIDSEVHDSCYPKFLNLDVQLGRSLKPMKLLGLTAFEDLVSLYPKGPRSKSLSKHLRVSYISYISNMKQQFLNLIAWCFFSWWVYVMWPSWQSGSQPCRSDVCTNPLTLILWFFDLVKTFRLTCIPCLYDSSKEPYELLWLLLAGLQNPKAFPGLWSISSIHGPLDDSLADSIDKKSSCMGAQNRST